jgi:hypothetical protein
MICSPVTPTGIQAMPQTKESRLKRMTQLSNLATGFANKVPELEFSTAVPATTYECRRRFTTLAIAAADPSALCSTRTELQLGGKSRTWMRQSLFTDTGLSEDSMSRLRRFDIDFDSSSEASYVGLDMCFYDGYRTSASAGGIC